MGLLRITGDDFLNPNNWVPDTEHEHRLYLDDHAGVYAVLDYEDWLWAIRWRWMGVTSRGGSKIYARRTARLRGGGWRSVFLHVEVMLRSGIEPPSSAHRIVDHRNGKSLHCRKSNLRWATGSMNRRNLYGQYPHDMMEG
jgi:hypothetical protein